MREVEKFKITWLSRKGGVIEDQSKVLDTKEAAKEFKKSLIEANELLRNSPIDIRISPILVKVADEVPAHAPEVAPEAELVTEPATEVA